MMASPRQPDDETPARRPLALPEIYREHVDYVWRLARSLGVPADSAEDVTQEVFLRVHDRLHTFHPDGSLRAWLFGITRNLVLHDRRRYARNERKLAALPAPADPESTPDAALSVHHAAELMQTFLDQLDLDKRLVFLHAEIEEMTAEEIAETLGVPKGTVYSRLRAARQKLDQFRQRFQARSDRRHV
ncbi:MAG: sigma-70 family RNA polymerase sigma factor [Myxococcales bacterium]|nr:sigma-70 family RNA polymerase sigma factor [Myxococcales bacterium]